MTTNWFKLVTHDPILLICLIVSVVTVPPTVGPNLKVNAQLRRLGFCLTYIWVSSKNSEIKYSTDGPLRKFKNLAKKLSDFDKNLTTQKTICVDLLVKISSKSDNFLAKFLLWNAKG